MSSISRKRVADLTPEQLERRRELGRHRSQKYYAKKREHRLEMQRWHERYSNAQVVPCSVCKVEVVAICGFCKEGLSG